MHFTILDNVPRRVISNIAVTMIASLPLVVVPFLGDPYQAPRAFLAAAAMILILAATLSTRSIKMERLPSRVLAALVAWYLLAATLAGSVSSLWGVHGRFQGLVSFLLLVVAVISGAAIDRRSVRAFAFGVSLSTLVISLLVLVQRSTGATPDSLSGNSAIAAQWLAVGVAITFAAAITVRGPHRLLLAGIASAGTLAVGATGSRAGALAVIVAGVCALAITSNAMKFRNLMAVAVAILLIGAGIWYSGAALEKYTPKAMVSGSARSRLEIWRATALATAAKPIAGHGPGRLLYELPALLVAEEGPDVRPDQAHSQPLQFAAEAGVPAALMLVALIGLALMLSWGRARLGDGAGAIAFVGLSAYVTQSMFGVASIDVDIVGWLLVGVAISGIAAGVGVASSAEGRSVPASLPVWPAWSVALVLCASVAWYCTANAYFASGVRHFSKGEFGQSSRQLLIAARMDPATDIYRVAIADTATYSGAGAREQALVCLNAGLVLEPESYDLALSKARLLASLGRPKGAVADAYRQALGLFPVGSTVRAEAMQAIQAAGEGASSDSPAATPGDDASAGLSRVSP